MLKSTVAAIVLLSATPAFAQTGQLPDPNDQSDTFSIGVGAGFIPDYEGSDDYKLIPVAGIRGRLSGFNYYTRGTYLYVDLIKRGDSPLEFDFGPIAGVRLNRTGKVKDNRVDDLPERDVAFEVGGFGGVTYHGLTNPYDALGFHVDVITDVSGAHGSTLITPTIDFGTPLSRTTYIADWAGNGYADYYYSISPNASLASGLPVFNADGGFKHWRLGLFGNQSLSGDLTHGWADFGGRALTPFCGGLCRL